ncbi:MAG: hypothetical protein KBF86_04460 [Chitinophagales bacterium]|jgi:hypothetical protein|nr:hypothetical protein [Chitinophagales bacterium]
MFCKLYPYIRLFVLLLSFFVVADITFSAKSIAQPALFTYNNTIDTSWLLFRQPALQIVSPPTQPQNWLPLLFGSDLSIDDSNDSIGGARILVPLADMAGQTNIGYNFQIDSVSNYQRSDGQNFYFVTIKGMPNYCSGGATGLAIYAQTYNVDAEEGAWNLVFFNPVLDEGSQMAEQNIIRIHHLPNDMVVIYAGSRLAMVWDFKQPSGNNLAEIVNWGVMVKTIGTFKQVQEQYSYLNAHFSNLVFIAPDSNPHTAKKRYHVFLPSCNSRAAAAWVLNEVNKKFKQAYIRNIVDFCPNLVYNNEKLAYECKYKPKPKPKQK